MLNVLKIYENFRDTPNHPSMHPFGNAGSIFITSGSAISFKKEKKIFVSKTMRLQYNNMKVKIIRNFIFVWL